MSNGNARVIKTGEWVNVAPYRKGYYISVPDNYVYADSSLDFHSPDYHKGYEQAKKDMMERAVEGEVYKFGEVAYVKELNNAELTKYLSQFNNGDKVKIIVIHETDIR